MAGFVSYRPLISIVFKSIMEEPHDRFDQIRETRQNIEAKMQNKNKARGVGGFTHELHNHGQV